MTKTDAKMGGWQPIEDGGHSLYTNCLNLNGIIGASIAQPNWVKAVYRREVVEDYTPFLTHLIASLIDILFVHEGKYGRRHVPSVIGLQLDNGTIDGYVMQHVTGTSAFPWDSQLSEWIPFVNAFVEVGIDMGYDVSDAHDGRIAQNILLDGWNIPDSIKSGILPSSWHRIDYGYSSYRLDWKELGTFLGEHSARIKSALSSMADVLTLAYDAKCGKKDPLEVNTLYHKALREYPVNLFADFINNNIKK
ncbi:hypothetical protein HYX01_03875 [Candidatus Woesearchaeota archaeon]|nr:hypothetical protein [Candidatus Woesearchaeota archaeon]